LISFVSSSILIFASSFFIGIIIKKAGKTGFVAF